MLHIQPISTLETNRNSARTLEMSLSPAHMLTRLISTLQMSNYSTHTLQTSLDPAYMFAMTPPTLQKTRL